MLTPSDDYRHDLLTGLPVEGGNENGARVRRAVVGSQQPRRPARGARLAHGRRPSPGLERPGGVSGLRGDDELRAFVSQLDANTAHSVEMVQKYAAQLGSKSLLGFDLCRYVAVCRWGCLCGYLTEDEAWDKIMPVAAKLQATFSSWKELGQNYLIGREFVVVRADSRGRRPMEHVDRLLGGHPGESLGHQSLGPRPRHRRAWHHVTDSG